MPGQGRKRQVCINAAVDDETLGMPFDASQCPYVTVWVKGSGTTSSGVVTIEEADYDPDVEPPYTGTWAPITTVSASDVTGGAQKSVHLPVSNYRFVRPRISTVIGGGGTITVVLTGLGAS